MGDLVYVIGIKTLVMEHVMLEHLQAFARRIPQGEVENRIVEALGGAHIAADADTLHGRRHSRLSSSMIISGARKSGCSPSQASNDSMQCVIARPGHNPLDARDCAPPPNHQVADAVLAELFEVLLRGVTSY